jgi:hypothetical protein
MRTILVPLYAHHDSGEWLELIKHYNSPRNTAISVILNPNDGPFVDDAKDVLAWRRLRSRFLSADVFGYIDLQRMKRVNGKWKSDGTKSRKDIILEVLRYRKDYLVTRFFFDDYHKGHAELVSSLKLHPSQVLVNPGTDTRTPHSAIRYESNGLPDKLHNFIALDIASSARVLPWSGYGYYHIANDDDDSPYHFLSPHLPSMLKA